MKLFLLFILVIAASLTGFVVHVFTVEWLPGWIGAQMQGIQLKPSCAVRYMAGLTSVEYGVAAIIIYALMRDKLHKYEKFKSAVFFSALLLAVNGTLIRQPLMDYLIGNPLLVVVVQNGFKWLPMVLMSFIIIYGYEYIIKKYSKNINANSCPQRPRAFARKKQNLSCLFRAFRGTIKS